MIQNSRRRDIAVAVRNAVEELWTHLSSRSNRSAEIHGRCARIEPLEGRTYFTSLYWDPSGAATADGGTGTWNTTSAIWRSGSPTGPLVAWSNSANSDAIFPGSNGVVTIYPAITAKSVSFNSTGYTISGGTLTLAGGYGSIDVALDATATINSTIAGTVGLTKADGGTLVLAGSNNYSGGTAVAGTLSINGSGTLGIGAVANSGLVQFTPYSPSIPTTIDLSDLLLSGGVYEVAPGVTAQLPGFLALYGGAEFVIDAGAMLQVPVNGSLGPYRVATFTILAQ